MDLKTPISGLPGIGTYFKFKLQYLGIHTIEDLINYFPFRYEDYSNVSNALEAKVGEKVTLIGEVWSIKNIYTRNRKVMTTAIFNDGTTPIELTWFNQPWLTKSILTGDKLQVSGKVAKFRNKYSIVTPVWEKYHVTGDRVQGSENLHTGRIVPVYPETEGLTSKWLRTRIDQILPLALPSITDPLPTEILDGMLPLTEAIQKIHFPKDWDEAKKARERLSFDELFYIQLATLKARSEWKDKPLITPIKIDRQKVEEFIKSLPFPLTDAQKRVIDQSLDDLEKNRPMNRLIQGEVGSGKTIVATVLMYALAEQGLKTLYMAPTEILALQHHKNISKLLEPLGFNVGIYTGSKKFNKGKKNAELRMQNDENQKLPVLNSEFNILNSPDIIVGTHALLSEKLITEDVGLVIIDEQQRFGVKQRSFLRSRAKIPHFLTMTATPIPRTVALTLYGDLDVSIIDELPKGRQKIKTNFVPKKKREDCYQFIEKLVKEKGDQIYIITPLIEQSETLQSVKSATAEFEKLKDIFAGLKLGLLHGRLKPKEKDQVLNDFKDHKLDILVSTTVVEVGVDVPNATVMLIESAERFGLAQLHQLRGRVGRGEKQSYCFLFSEVEDSGSVLRLKNLETIDDGMKLAELDLKIRGSGEIFGSRQSGRFELKLADFTDLSLIEKTRTAAQKLIDDDPKLDKHPLLKEKVGESIVAPD